MGFNTNLKFFREKANISRTEMATYLSITPAAYGAYELGKREPNYKILCKLADIFGISTDRLLGHDMDEQTKIKNGFSKLECNVEFFNDYAKLEYNGRIFYVDKNNLTKKYEICESEALYKYDDALINNMSRVLFNYVIDSQPISEFNQNARKRAREKNIPIDATTKKSPADDNQKQNSDPNQCNSYFEGLRTLIKEHYPEKAQPPATTEKLVHDELKKTNRLGRKTKQKSPTDDNRQG